MVLFRSISLTAVDYFPSRRQFLVGSLSGLSSAWIALHWPAAVEAHEHAKQVATTTPGEFEFFSADQAIEVEAIAAQIIPSDGSPGAREAGAIYFIDRALTTFDHTRQPLYTDGLKSLEMQVSERFVGSAKFSSLTTEQQMQLLTVIEKTEFFDAVRLHTIMGFLCDPSYGGNRDQVGWKLIGFEQRPSFKPPFGYYDAEEKR
jgi:gluconate 2-dehydrogenase gamma chain